MSREPYIREIPNTWWLQNASYRKYMLREMSSPFIAIYTAILLVGLVRLYQGPEAYDAWLLALQSPVSIGFSVVAIALAMYHTTSWLGFAPQVLPLQIGETLVPSIVLVAAHYVLFIAIFITALVLTNP